MASLTSAPMAATAPSQSIVLRNPAALVSLTSAPMTAAAPPHILLCSRTPASTRLAIARCGADAPGGEASQNSLTRYGLYSSKWAWKWEWVHR